MVPASCTSICSTIYQCQDSPAYKVLSCTESTLSPFSMASPNPPYRIFASKHLEFNNQLHLSICLVICGNNFVILEHFWKIRKHLPYLPYPSNKMKSESESKHKYFPFWVEYPVNIFLNLVDFPPKISSCYFWTVLPIDKHFWSITIQIMGQSCAKL